MKIKRIEPRLFFAACGEKRRHFARKIIKNRSLWRSAFDIQLSPPLKDIGARIAPISFNNEIYTNRTTPVFRRARRKKAALREKDNKEQITLAKCIRHPVVSYIPLFERITYACRGQAITYNASR